MTDFSKWVCRASQASKLMTGSFGITEKQHETIAYLDGKISSGKALTDLQKIEYNDLVKKRDNPTLSKTTISELKKIFRNEKYGRTSNFTNKYVQKGNLCEEDSITLVSRVIGMPLFKNEERRTDDWFTGLADITKPIGLDVKSVWSLDTLPMKSNIPEAHDELDTEYEWQNQVYAWLWDSDKWVTAYCLVNATERMIFTEKQKHWYGLGQPELDDPVYINICREIERNMIFDVPRFVREYPNFDWDNEDLEFSIPEKERVVLYEVKRDESKLNSLKERIKEARKILKSLQDEGTRYYLLDA